MNSFALSQVSSANIKSPRATYLETLKKTYAGISPKEFASLAIQTIKIYGMTVQVKDAWDQGAAYVPAEKERKLIVVYTVFSNGVNGATEQRPFVVDYKFIGKLPDVVVRSIKKLSDVHAMSRKRSGQNGNTVLGRGVPHYVSGSALGLLVNALGLSGKFPALIAGYATRYAATLLITSYISQKKLHSLENGQIIMIDGVLSQFLNMPALISTTKSHGEVIKKFTNGVGTKSIGTILTENFAAASPYRQFVSVLEVLHAFKDEEGHGITDAVFRSAKKQGKALIGNTQSETTTALTPLYNQYDRVLSDPFYSTGDNARRKSEYVVEANKKQQAKTFSAQQFPFSSVATINSLIVVSAKLLQQTATPETARLLGTLEDNANKQTMLNEESFLETYHKDVKNMVEASRAKLPKKVKPASSKKGSLGPVVHFQKQETQILPMMSMMPGLPTI